MKDVKLGGNGITFVDLLLILFIGLKLAGVITWSWWLVFSPLWIGFMLMLVIVAIMVTIGAFKS